MLAVSESMIRGTSVIVDTGMPLSSACLLQVRLPADRAERGIRYKKIVQALEAVYASAGLLVCGLESAVRS